MALPNSRDKTFTPFTDVPSAVLNNIQDAIILHETRVDAAEVDIADHEGRVNALELRTRHVHPFSGIAGGTWVVGPVSFNDMETGDDDNSVHYIPIDVVEGTEVSIQLICQHATATVGAINAQLVRNNADGTATVVATVDSIASALVQTMTIVLAHVVVAGAYALHVKSPVGTGAFVRKLFDVIVQDAYP